VPTSSDFLDGLASVDVERLFAEGVRRTVTSGEFLCREGETGAAIHIVLAGYLKLTKTAVSGRETMLELRGPGDVLGEMSVVDGGGQSANAIALGPVDVLSIGASRFNALRRERAPVANALLEVLVGRLRQASARQHELGTCDAIDRVCRRIAELARTHGESTADGILVRVLSQQELADWAGVSRDGVVRALHELRSEGLVESGRGRLLIRDLPGVAHRAGTEGDVDA